MRDSFIFYRSFYEAINDLPNEFQLELYKAIAQYSIDGIDPVFTGLSKTIWTLIKPQLNANKKRYKNGKLGAKYGKLGGRPKNPIGVISENPIPKKQKTPNKNENVNENVNENKNVNAKARVREFTKIEDLTDPVCEKVSTQYQVSVFDVKNLREELRLYCISSGKKYADYHATLQAWVRRKIDLGKLKPTATATPGVMTLSERIRLAKAQREGGNHADT